MSLDWSIPDAAPVATRELEPPCRCGWIDDKPCGNRPTRVPVIDLSGQPGLIQFEPSPVRRTCRACTHPIHAGHASVVHRLTAPGGIYNRYHPECCEFGGDDA